MYNISETRRKVRHENWKRMYEEYRISGIKVNDLIKALLWEWDGLLLLYNRLDNGKFQQPRNKTEVQQITAELYTRARCYCIIESANLNGLNVFWYLSYLITELPKLDNEPTDEMPDNLFPWSETLPNYCKNA